MESTPAYSESTTAAGSPDEGHNDFALRTDRQQRILVIGAGPTGLGACTRLQQLKHENWAMFERTPDFGGLAYSWYDNGFCYDCGPHIMFSHYQYYDDCIIRSGVELLPRQRFAYIQQCPGAPKVLYPLQQYIHRYPPEDHRDCLLGLIKAAVARGDQVRTPASFSNFKEWLYYMFGDRLCELFMIPYNYKVWSFPAEEMQAGWIGERVATVDMKKAIGNAVMPPSVESENSGGWGPNATFLYPVHGGIGAIWNHVGAKLPPKNVLLNTKVKKIDAVAKRVFFEDGSEDHYDVLISTMPITELVKLSGLDQSDNSLEANLIKDSVSKLKFSTTHVLGLGIVGKLPEVLEGTSWIYYPNSDCEFYRLINYKACSPFMVPDPETMYSFGIEVSESEHTRRPEGETTEEFIEKILKDLDKYGLITGPIISKAYRKFYYGYPTPHIDRDAALKTIQPILRNYDIYSRGRFGGWKYEVGNQDHSFMQGVEAVDQILSKGAEKGLCFAGEHTITDPSYVNNPANMSKISYEQAV